MRDHDRPPMPRMKPFQSDKTAIALSQISHLIKAETFLGPNFRTCSNEALLRQIISIAKAALEEKS